MWYGPRRDPATGTPDERDDMTDAPLLSRILLMDMKREWKALQSRYGAFAEFVEMVRKDVA